MSENHSSSPTIETSKPQFRFDTPLYLQRYDYTLDVIRKYDCKTHIDIGCNDCKLIKFVKNSIDSVNLIVGVDVDDECLANAKLKFNENFMDLLQQRQEPLEVYFIRGDISQPSPYFVETLSHANIKLDLVSLVEVIEHMHAPTLKGCIRTVFGLLKPRVVLITTPNGEFNVVFDDYAAKEGPGVDNGESFGEPASSKKANNGFRHWDHKFEWTRHEFQTWCQSEILDEFDDYELVRYDGLGVAPPHFGKDVGFCTQIAVVKRKDEFVPDYRPDNDALAKHLKKLRRANCLRQSSSLTNQQSLYETEPFIQHEKFGGQYWDFSGPEYRMMSFIRYPFEAIEYESEEERQRDVLGQLKHLISFMTARPAFRRQDPYESSHLVQYAELDDEDRETATVEIERLASFASMKKFGYSSSQIAHLLREHNYMVTSDDKYLIHVREDCSVRSWDRLGMEQDEEPTEDVPYPIELDETWSIDTDVKKRNSIKVPKPRSSKSHKKSKSKKRARDQEPLDLSQFEDSSDSWDMNDFEVAPQKVDQACFGKEICYFQEINLEVERRLAKLKKKRSKQARLQDVLDLGADFDD